MLHKSTTASLVLLLPAPLFAQPGFTLLDPLPGGGASHAFAASLDGRWVVGEGRSANAGLSGQEAFRWSASTGMLGLGPLNGSYRSAAYGVSSDGQVVVGTANQYGFRWTPATGMESLGLLPGVSSTRPSGVSADGNVVVGWCFSPDTAFYWTPKTGIQPVPFPSGFRSTAQAISADGRIVVGTASTTSIATRSYRWDRHEPEPFFLPAAPTAEGRAFVLSVSPDGAILGGATLDNPQHAWVWTAEHGYTILDPAPGTFHCRVNGISNDGTVLVGICTVIPDARAVVWIGPGPQGPYQAQFLTDYATQRGVSLPPNITIPNAWDISANGRVIVGGTYFYQAFRLEFCYANCDDSTTQPYLNVDDFTCFINRFSAGMSLPHEKQLYHYANCDHSTIAPVLNVDDFTCFINRFAQGCPSP